MAALFLLATAAPAAAVVTFSFDYSGDGANEGFNDPTLGTGRRTALEAAAMIWGNILVPRYTGETIVVRATFDSLGGSSTSATLGQAGGAGAAANFSATSPKYVSSTVYVSALANHLHGSDLGAAATGASQEINPQFNSNVDNSTVLGNTNFYYGTDSNHGSNIDFETVALHELGHGLGFSASIQSDGTFLNGESTPDAFDRFLYRGSTKGIGTNFLTARPAATARPTLPAATFTSTGRTPNSVTAATS